MSTRAALALATALALPGCAAHERTQEPTPTCPEGMVLIGASDGVADFCLDVGEVTTAAYAACVEAGGCAPALVDGQTCNIRDGGRGDHPINCASFAQAEAYCARLGKRLPELEEWRAAVRGGDRSRPFPWGREVADRSRACVARTPEEGTCPVGAYPTSASAAGVVDLIGNVREWVTTAGGVRTASGGAWTDAAPLGVGEPEAPAEGPGGAPLAGDASTGLRCAVAPYTAVQAVDERAFTPYRPEPRDLPRLAGPLSRPRPSRPLANQAILARAQADAASTRWWPLEGGYVEVDAAAASRLGVAPSEVLEAAAPGALADLRPRRSLTSFSLWTGGWAASLRVVALERGAPQIRWQRSFDAYGTSYEQVVGPQTLVASLFGDRADGLVAFALSDGAEVWRQEGAVAGEFNRIRRLWIDEERGFVVGDRGLLAFDPATGATAWAEVAVAEGCGVISGGDVVVIEEAQGGHRLIDAASGGELGRLRASSAGGCGWGKSEYDGGVALPVIERGLLYALEPQTGRGGAVLRALELEGGGERWRREGVDASVLVVDQDAVYTARRGEVLVALDAASGRPQAEISIGGEFEVALALGGGEAGPLVVITSDATGTWFLGRGAAPAIAEDVVVSGRLVVDEGVGKRRAAGVSVRVGDRRVRTDARGRFRAKARLVGALVVVPGDERDPYELVEGGGRIFTFDPTHVVLDGSGAYDLGDITLYEWFAA